MTDPNMVLITAFSSLAGVTVASAAFLKAWRGWLEIKRVEISGTGLSSRPGARTDLADLKERIRRLEAIASGIE